MSLKYKTELIEAIADNTPLVASVQSLSHKGEIVSSALIQSFTWSTYSHGVHI